MARHRGTAARPRGRHATDILGLVGLATSGKNVDLVSASLARLFSKDGAGDLITRTIERSDEYRRAAAGKRRQKREDEKARAKAGAKAPTSMDDYRTAISGATPNAVE